MEILPDEKENRLYFETKSDKISNRNPGEPQVVMDKVFFENAIHVNASLWKNVFIDKDGRYRITYLDNQSYGTVLKVPLVDIINDSTYTWMWFIKNDKITHCKTCILRYSCMSVSPIYMTESNEIRKYVYCLDYK